MLVPLARLIFSFSSLCSLAVKLKRGAQNLLSEGKWESGGKYSSGSSRGSTVDWAYAQYFIGRREKVTPAATAAGGIKNCVMPTMHRVALAQVGVLQQGRESEECERESGKGREEGGRWERQAGARQSFCTCSQVLSCLEPRLRGLHVFLVKCILPLSCLPHSLPLLPRPLFVHISLSTYDDVVVPSFHSQSGCKASIQLSIGLPDYY